MDSSPVHRSPNGDLNQNVVEVSHEKKKKKFKNRRHSAPGIFQSFVLRTLVKSIFNIALLLFKIVSEFFFLVYQRNFFNMLKNFLIIQICQKFQRRERNILKILLKN